jgi:glucose-6-phosphate-specific signal transduction histidine kinase
VLLTIHSPSENDKEQAVEALLTQAHRQISALLRQLPPPDIPDVSRGGLLKALRHLVNHELAGRFDRIDWMIEPAAEAAAAELGPLQVEVLYYAARETLRNSAHHARPEDNSRPLNVTITMHLHERWCLIIEDNGMGIHPAKTSTSGSGQGLALHSTMMTVVGGLLTVDSIPGKLTRVTLSLPLKR